MNDQNDVNPADYGYFDDEPERMTLRDSAPAALATLVHAHLVETGRDTAASSLFVGVGRDEVSIQIRSPGANGKLEPVLLPSHHEIEERLVLAQRNEDLLSLGYGTLEVDFGADFQSQQRAGARTIDFRLGDIGLERSHFGLENVVDEPTRLEKVAQALADVHASRLPAGSDRRFSLIVDDENAYAYALTTSFSGEPMRSIIQLEQTTKDRVIAMLDDPQGADFSPISSDTTRNTVVQAARAPFAYAVEPGADERLEAALSAPAPGSAGKGLLGQAQSLGSNFGKTSSKGPDNTPRHDPIPRGRDIGR